jgi:DNA/RNA endonuclease G (NUC1)
MSVFTGPVLRSDDPKFDNHGKMSSPTQIPTAFWKVAVWNEPGKGLVGEGYVMSQADILKGNSSGALIELTKPEDFKPFRVSLENIEKMTSIHFGPIKDQSVQ